MSEDSGSDASENVERYGVEDPEEYPFVAGMNVLLPDSVPTLTPRMMFLVVAVVVGVVAVVGLVSVGQVAVDSSLRDGSLPNGSVNPVPNDSVDEFRDLRSFSGNVTGVDEGGRLVVANESMEVVVSMKGVERAGEVSPSRYGLADTEANRTCLRRAEGERRAFLERYEGERVWVVANGSDFSGDSVDRAVVLSSESSLNRLVLAHGFGDAVRDAEYGERESYERIADRAGEAGIGVWSCPGYRGGQVPVNATREGSVGV